MTKNETEGEEDDDDGEEVRENVVWAQQQWFGWIWILCLSFLYSGFGVACVVEVEGDEDKAKRNQKVVRANNMYSLIIM